MNFNRMLIFFITFIFLAVTAGGFILFCDDPFSEEMLLRYVPVLFAEFLCGLFMGLAFKGKDDLSFPYFLTNSVLDVCYLLFTIAMAFVSPEEIGVKLFVFIHVIALLLLFGVCKLLLSASLRNMGQQSKKDSKVVGARRNLFRHVTEILEISKQIFANNSELVKKCQKVCDNFRYAGDVFADSEEEFHDLLSQLQDAVERKDEAGANNLLDKLSIKITCCQKHSLV